MARRPAGTRAQGESTAELDYRGLARQLRGRLILPGDREYRQATRLWNGMIEKHPDIVVRCAGADDVAAAVTAAGAHGLPLAVRGGGHGVAGYAMSEGGLVIDLSTMTGVVVDPRARTAHADGGCTLADVDRATQAHGLATPLGVVSRTGIGGLTLSGGMGWLRRKYGLSCDNLLGAEIVTADGRVLHVDDSEHEDLFWAIRGGGGNFGVVTSFEYRLHPVGPEVFFCFVLYPADRAVEVLRAAERFVAGEPAGVAPVGVLGRVPAVAEFPAQSHGAPFVALLGLYPGEAGDGERILEPLRRITTPIGDVSGRMPYLQAQSVLDEEYPDGWRYYWKSINLPRLSDEVITRLADSMASAPCPHSTIDVWFQGGAMAEVGDADSAVGNRSTPYLIGIEGNCQDASGTDANLAWVRATVAGLKRFSTGGIYLNFPGFLEEGEELLREGLGNYQRLVEVKTRYDPGNVFRFNANIVPRQ